MEARKVVLMNSVYRAAVAMQTQNRLWGAVRDKVGQFERAALKHIRDSNIKWTASVSFSHI